jgi:hypothetical protein
MAAALSEMWAGQRPQAGHRGAVRKTDPFDVFIYAASISPDLAPTSKPP